ncbi:hypothetical protein PVAP13_8KG142000 [Panicum virgatum]|uniref:Uncharacterized protein n=1 Tax=Panicum virgatum TaxID=38727 RepID=A0A8T0PK91_PANVG|nr:hypothetical protein PVAP13_8KG142000 [Panicum virgatum]
MCFISSYAPFFLPFQITAMASSISPTILSRNSCAPTDTCFSHCIELAAPPLRRRRPTASTSPARHLSLEIDRGCRRRGGGRGFGDSSSSMTSGSIRIDADFNQEDLGEA